MPNTKGGKKYKKSKHSIIQEVNVKLTPLSDNKKVFIPIEFRHNIKENTQYAIMNKILGGFMAEAHDRDGTIYRCVIPGSMRKRVYINPGDVILIQRRIQLRQDDKYDVIYKYSADEIKFLQSINHINFDINKNMDDCVQFEESLDEKKDKSDESESESSGSKPKEHISINKNDKGKRVYTFDDI